MPDDDDSGRFNRPDAVALREHLECRIAAQAAFFDARIGAIEKATDIATARLAERLAGMNEFRESMNDMASRMITRNEVDIQVEKIESQLADLKKSRDQLEGKASQKSADIALLFGAAGTVISIVGLLLHIFTM